MNSKQRATVVSFFRWRCGVLVFAAALTVTAVSAEPTAKLTVRSSNQMLDESFAWAKAKALSYVRTDKQPDYIPCYFAAMSDREFCVRDTSHQLEGAHLLGLDAENWSMILQFARGANRRVDQDYCWPRWHYPYTGKVADERSCQWRTLPAPFDMAWRSYEQYLWTADAKWIDDPEMFRYHTNLHTKFMEHQKWADGEVADELIQLASYFEFPDAGEQFIEAGDAIGCQYQALLAYAKILEHRRDADAARTFRKKAEHLRALFETHWYDEAAGCYIRGFDRFTDFRSDWGRENSYFMPMTLITDQGPRTAAYLDFIEASIQKDALNIEAQTYLPEVFYKHGRNDTAWKYLKQTLQSRHNYPEVSFTCVGNIVSGLMGVRPDAPAQTVATLPSLTDEVAWIDANHVAVGGHELRIRHDGRSKSTLENRRGPAITWLAQFPGNFVKLEVDDAARPASVTTLNGRTVSGVTVTLAAGKSATVRTLGVSGPDLPPPPSPKLIPEPMPKPKPGKYYLSDMKWRYASARAGDVFKQNAAPDGKPLSLAGLEYAKGLAVRGLSAVRYDLGRNYSRFLADVGFLDPVHQQGRVEFVIFGGGNTSKLLYRSGPLAVEAAVIRHISIDVGGCDYLVLGVRDVAQGSGDPLVAWADARVVAKGGTSDTEPPSVPQDLRAAEIDHSSVLLEWSVASDNVGVAGYDIYSGSLTVGSSKTPSFRVTGLHPNAEYHFSVKAWDADGNASVASQTVKVVTTLPPDLVYLSQLKWESATSGFGGVGKDRSVDGKPIRIHGTAYTHGLGTHATSEIVYDLEKLGRRYARFQCDAGIDNEISAMGSVAFQVYADDEKRFDSGVIKAGEKAQKIDVDISGAKRLRLVVTDGGDGINSDHADWADARLTRAADESSPAEKRPPKAAGEK